MTLRIPVVFDPDTRLIVEDPTGSNAPFETVASSPLVAGSFVNLFYDSGTAKIQLAESASVPAIGFILADTTGAGVVYTTGINKQVAINQGDGEGGTYDFVASDVGSVIYLDPANPIAGKLTKILPTTANYQRIGIVVEVGLELMSVSFLPSINVAQDTLSYKGTWDAQTNTPSLSTTPPTGSRGWYYVVSVGGDALPGISLTGDWIPGDWILSDGTTWSRINNSTGVQLATSAQGLPSPLSGSGAVGTSTFAAPYDHAHPMISAVTIQDIILEPSGGALPLPNGDAAIGDAIYAAREDHVHPKNAIKTPIRYYFETPVATTDQQPALRIDGASNLQAIRYYSKNAGNGTIKVYRNGVGLATLSLSSSDNLVTFQDSGDTVTRSNHGLPSGSVVSFSSVTTTTGVTANTPYYVVNALTNTFQISLTLGGPVNLLTTDGSGSTPFFLTQAGFTPRSLASGDIITIAVTGTGSAFGVTVQLDIEQYA